MMSLLRSRNIVLSEKERRILNVTFVMLSILVFAAIIVSPFATSDYGQETIKTVINQMVDIIGLVFRSVGVILAVYAVGQLVLAFKNEDADSKSRASTMLVVGIVLIALPTIIKSLKLTDYIKQ